MSPFSARSTRSVPVRHPSCPLQLRPPARPISKPLTWEELLGQR